MSANNWKPCPKCITTRSSKRETAIANVKKTYGKVSADDYDKALLGAKLLGAKEAKDEPADKDTMREDYEIRTDDEGTFNVSYACSCTHCGFKFSYEHSENVLKSK